MKSIERRLQLALGLCLALFALLLWAGATRLLDSLATDLINERLAHDTEALLAALEFNPDGTPRWKRVDAIFERPFSGHYFVVVTAAGSYTSRSLWDEHIDVEPLPAGSNRQWRTRGPAQQTLLVHAAGFRKSGNDVTVAVAENIAAIALYRTRLHWGILGFAVGGVVLLALAQRVVLRRAFRSLTGAARELRELDAGRRERLSENVVAEVQPFVREVNHLLASLVKRLERSRAATADLAHALKTPLQLLLQDLDEATPAAIADARAQAERVRALAGRELKRARVAGSGQAGQRFARADLDDLLEAVRKMHARRAAVVDCAGTEQFAPFAEREDMLELFGNLLDNACKWARGHVHVEVADGPTVVVRVSDDGPGLAADQIERVGARGVRLDETREGHGLGLAIVRDIVTAHGGEIALDRSPALGGLRVTVRLPRAAPA
ncbi:MAG: sensor histidine kinase [Gammaproteobacteria bacterium]|nr:sensor histidine kinase [Gammaproteobacteria bacterium]